MFAQQKRSDVQRQESGDSTLQKLSLPPPKPAAPKSAKGKPAVKQHKLPEGPPPDMNVNYPAWVAHMKPFWRKHLAERNALQQSGVRSGGGRLGSMLRSQAISLDSNIWDIVQIAEVAERPGEFKLWLLIKDTLQAVRLYVPRQFLMNLKTIPEDQEWPTHCQVEAVSKTLPRSHAAMNLLQLTTSEDLFLRQESTYSTLLNRPEVDGIYELQIPLLVRALMQLGTSCIAAGGVSLAQGLDKGFTLDHLMQPQITLSRHQYLDLGRSLNFRY